MEILIKALTKDGMNIQLENWHVNFESIPFGSTIACYPRSKVESSVPFGPKKGETFRLQVDFENNETAINAFRDILFGEKKLYDFTNNISDKRLLEYI